MSELADEVILFEGCAFILYCIMVFLAVVSGYYFLVWIGVAFTLVLPVSLFLTQLIALLYEDYQRR